MSQQACWCLRTSGRGRSLTGKLERRGFVSSSPSPKNNKEFEPHHVLAYHANARDASNLPPSPLPQSNHPTATQSTIFKSSTSKHSANLQHITSYPNAPSLAAKDLHTKLTHNGPPTNTPHPRPAPCKLPTPHRAHIGKGHAAAW